MLHYFLPKFSVVQWICESGGVCPDTQQGLRSTSPTRSCSRQPCQALTDLTAQPKNPFQTSCQAPLAPGELRQLGINRMKPLIYEVQAAAGPRINLLLLYSKEQVQGTGHQEALSAQR